MQQRRNAIRLFVCLLLFASAAAAAEPDDPAQAARDAIIVETVMRLENFDLSTSEKAQAAVDRFLTAHRGDDRYFELIERFAIEGRAAELVELAAQSDDVSQAARSVRLALQLGGEAEIEKALAGEAKPAAKLVEAVGNAGGVEATKILVSTALNEQADGAVRRAAVTAAAQGNLGQQRLLELVEGGELPEALKFAAANALHASSDAQIRAAAERLLPLPKTMSNKPLPPIAKLIEQSGDAEAGAKVFRTTGTCIKCHKLGDEGQEVGPDLSEIGSKLSKQAMFVAILDPSAGISHNYETYGVLTVDGEQLTGILVSQTDDELVLRTEKGVTRTFATDDLDAVRKMEISLMPADLQKTMTVDQLIDVVEYMQTLKKPAS